MSTPWFTPADRAEQAVLVRELVDWWFDNPDATAAEQREKIEALLAWRDDRSARSLAVELRAIEDLIDLPELAR